MKTLEHTCFALSICWIALLSAHGLLQFLHPLTINLYNVKWFNWMPAHSVNQPQGWIGLWPLGVALALVLLGMLFGFLSRNEEKEGDA
jgi:hypothetical protein